MNKFEVILFPAFKKDLRYIPEEEEKRLYLLRVIHKKDFQKILKEIF